MAEVTVNGEIRTVDDGTTVEGLLAVLSLQKTHVAVELNREIVPRAEYGSVGLRGGDSLEIVTFVGGG